MAYNVCCRVDHAEALRYLGYSGQRVDETLKVRFEAAVAACEEGCSPVGTFAVFPRGHVATNALLKGLDIARFLQGATHCALMAVTLGAQCERELRRFSALSPTDALFYDAACSALVEAAANGLQEHILLDATGRGLEMLPGRFSPGYGDLPLDVQKPLLAAIDAYRTLGLSATEDFLLVPRKSITAIVGLRERGAGSGAECLDGAGHRAGVVCPDGAGRPGEAACTNGMERFGDAARFDDAARAAVSSEKINACSACAMADRCAYRCKGESCHGL